MSLNRLNTKSANVLENPLKKIYYYEITKLIGMHCIALHCIALHCIALHCIALHCDLELGVQIDIAF
jgi:hypothetical protein